MKRIFYTSLIIPLLISSCEVVPESSFFTDNVNPVIGEEVYFSNNSYNAEWFDWDFGDGTGSDVPSPIHVYTASGQYRVALTAFSKSGLSDISYLNIEVKTPTLLEIEVLEYYEAYPVEGASVILYPTLSDWDSQRNMVSEGFTGSSGKVVFSGLGNNVFYVDVWEADHNNYALRDEDVGFIRTDQVHPNEINRFIAYVDYVGGKGSGERDRKIKIVSIVPRRLADK